MKYQVTTDFLVQHQVINPFGSNQVMRQVPRFPCFFAISLGSHPLSIHDESRSDIENSSFGAYFALKNHKIGNYTLPLC